MASSSSSSTTRCRRRVAFLRQPSREDEYEGRRRYYYHQFPAPRCTAWTEANPCRRFYGCRNYDQYLCIWLVLVYELTKQMVFLSDHCDENFQDGGCGFFAWHDDQFGDRANEVIKGLLNDIDKLYDENIHLRKGKDRARFYEELEVIHGKVRDLKERHDDKENELRKGEMKLRLMMGYLFFTLLWLFIMYMRK